MRETRISLPELALIAGTRVALGAGLALLHADRFSEEQRKAVGWTLFAIGALSTIPLGLEVLGGHRLSDSANGHERNGHERIAGTGPDFRAMAEGH
jgi:hypothetical protein